MATIRFLREEDIPAAAEIVRENYSAEYAQKAVPELKEMFSSSLVRPRYLVADDGGAITGFAGFAQTWMDYHVASIFWVMVARSSQRQGIGKKLVGRILWMARLSKEKVYLVTLTTTSPEYYKKNFGFKTDRAFGPDPQHHHMSLEM